jgi:DNA sulfur modification protein DndC
MKKTEHIEKEIVDQYLYDENKNRPWIVGFSGGKDSTVVLQLIWSAISKIDIDKRIRDIHVVCNDTLVENPIIESYVNKILLKIQKEATKQGLPIFVYKSIPTLDETFWIKLIGLGYPAPNNQFRWCTERLKIDPTSRYIKSIVKKREEAIVILGTRTAESSNRAKTIKKHNIVGNRLSAHPSLKNTYIFLPIKNLVSEEVWYCISTMSSPWGADNETLFNIYMDASSDDYECPSFVTNKNTPSCGQSRFGCWVCTVVTKDRSTSALIKNGYEWLKPLLDIRNSLVEERNKPENREDYRRNGQYLKNGGPYKPEYRTKVLERVLKAQKEVQKTQPYIELISHQELVAIQVMWYQDKFYKIKVSDIYNKIFQKRLNMKNIDDKIKKEKELLKKSVSENPEHFELIQDLLKIQKTKDLMIRKIGLNKGIKTRIEEFIKAGKNEN